MSCIPFLYEFKKQTLYLYQGPLHIPLTDKLQQLLGGADTINLTVETDTEVYSVLGSTGQSIQNPGKIFTLKVLDGLNSENDRLRAPKRNFQNIEVFLVITFRSAAPTISMKAFLLKCLNCYLLFQ